LISKIHKWIIATAALDCVAINIRKWRAIKECQPGADEVVILINCTVTGVVPELG